MTTNWTPRANRSATRNQGSYSKYPPEEQKTRRIIGDRLLAKLERELVRFELSDCERDFEFANCVVDDNFDPLSLSPDTVRKIGNNQELILDALIRRQRVLEKFQEAWWLHDKDDYREYCQQYWAMQKTAD